ncbi:hypothetical protein WA158_004382 [Blastocystis sp. Blastoise]
MLIDSHCHLHFTRIRSQFTKLYENAMSNHINYFVCNATNLNDLEDVKQLSINYNNIIPCFGIHPYYADTVTSENVKSILEPFLLEFPHSNIGEIGLDKSSKGKRISMDIQEKLFETQLLLAKEYNRIPVIHCVKSYGKILDILRKLSPLPRGFLMHGYNGPFNMVKDFSKLGGYFSISASLFNTNHDEDVIKKVLMAIPEDRLLIETDSPDMILKSCIDNCECDEEGMYINDPSNLTKICELVAKYLGKSEKEIELLTSHNASTFFDIHIYDTEN